MKANNKRIVFGISLLLLGTFTLLITKDSINKDKSLVVKSSNINENKNVIAAYVIQDNGEYKQVDDIPQSGYVLNTSKSTCSNGATPTGKTPNITINNLTKNGTKCYLYFDKGIVIDDIIAGLNAKTTTPDFSQIATTDEGVYSTTDGMYGNTTYYWRGAATTNHVIFANKCWRIVRINGDNTLRLIYNGTVKSGNTCTGNGTNADAVIFSDTTDSKVPNLNRYATTGNDYNNPSYVGWTYQLSNLRPTSIANETSSNVKTQTENWYKDTTKGNLVSYEDKIESGKFCNDRSIGNGSWNTGSTTFYYAGYTRLKDNKKPTFECPKEDVYTLKVGAITADEVAFAGGVYGTNNDQYYMHTGQLYWAMTPYYWISTNAVVFFVSGGGRLSNAGVNYTEAGLRPVINLKSNTTFVFGTTGTLDNPYVVQ